jgi:acyl-CoA thioesterase I
VSLRRALVICIALWLPCVLPARAAGPRLLVCYGDSITAGYGLEEGQAYPDDLQHDLDAQGYHYRVLNRGTSGATSKDAVAVLPEILALHPDVVIVEFGGNDGLRGLPLDQTRRNLDQVLDALAEAHVRVLLGGITLPPNYGADYIQTFQQVFRDVAAAHPRDAFVPMIYKNLIPVAGTIQADGIHPTAKGSVILAQTLLPALKPLLVK